MCGLHRRPRSGSGTDVVGEQVVVVYGLHAFAADKLVAARLGDAVAARARRLALQPQHETCGARTPPRPACTNLGERQYRAWGARAGVRRHVAYPDAATCAPRRS